MCVVKDLCGEHKYIGLVLNWMCITFSCSSKTGIENHPQFVLARVSSLA